jgi:hypothetical protein
MIFRVLITVAVAFLSMSNTAHAAPAVLGSLIIDGLYTAGLGGLLPTISAAAIGHLVVKKFKR